MNRQGIACRTLPWCVISIFIAQAAAAAGVFVRFQLVEPATTNWFARLGGYIHNEPWYLPATNWPVTRVAPGQCSPWFDLATHAGQRLHGQLHRAGGVAEFPNVTVEFVGGGPTNVPRRVVIELATAPDSAAMVKRFEESFTGTKTSFLVSPTLRADADALEIASQMTARRLAWARAASGAPRLVELSHPIVEAGVFEAERGVALVLANFTYQPIPKLEIRLPVKRAPQRVRSLEKGPLPFKLDRSAVVCTVELGLNDILLFE